MTRSNVIPLAYPADPPPARLPVAIGLLPSDLERVADVADDLRSIAKDLRAGTTTAGDAAPILFGLARDLERTAGDR